MRLFFPLVLFLAGCAGETQYRLILGAPTNPPPGYEEMLEREKSE